MKYVLTAVVTALICAALAAVWLIHYGTNEPYCWHEINLHMAPTFVEKVCSR